MSLRRMDGASCFTPASKSCGSMNLVIGGTLTTAPTSQIKAAQQSRQLLIGKFHALFIALRQLKDTFLKALVPDAEPIAVPIQNLHPVTAAVEEQEQVA